MISQKSLSHSSWMVYAAPSLRLFLLPPLSRFLDELVLEMNASSLAEVRAARGGLDGGEGIPEGFPRTSGKPPYPTGPGSAVVKARQLGRRIDDVAASKDIGLTSDSLAIAIITSMVVTGRHCCRE